MATANRIVFPSAGVAALETEELPELGPGQVLMRTTHSLISTGTELALYLDENEMNGAKRGDPGRFPVYPGYAAVGRIEAVGAAGDELTPGQRVFADTGHSSHVIFDPARKMCLPIPEDAPGGSVAFIRMALITLATLCRADIRPGEWLGVTGLGIVGNLGAQFGALAGYRVVAAGRSELRNQRARACGIETIVTGDAAAVGEQVREMTGGDGCRFVLDTTGTSEGLLKAVKMAGRGGTVSLVGVPWKVDTSVDLSSITHQLFSNYITIKGGWEWDLPLHRKSKGVKNPAVRLRPTIEDNARYALDSVVSGKIVTEPLVTHTISPDDAQTAYDGLAHSRNEYMGVVIDWS